MANFKILTTIAILAFSTIMPALAFAQPVGLKGGNDWHYVNGNSWGMNYSPANQITNENADAVEVKWIFPLQATTAAPSGMQSLSLKQGSTTPPIVQDGMVYTTTNFLRTYAINATTGRQEWVFNYNIDIDEVVERLPLVLSGGGLQGHLHGFRYWEAGNALLLAGMACDFYGIDADSGEQSFWVKDLCLDIPGNIYDYRQGTVSQTNIGTWETGRQWIFVLPGIQHSSTTTMGDFRHTTIGVDYDTHNIVWRLYSYPPQGVLTKDWALQECDIGFFRDIPCSTVAAQAPQNLEWDWTAADNEPPHPVGGVTANWGEIIIDEDTGLAYTNTGNQGPYTYIGLTRGPRLYGSTLMAIDADTGQRVWWSQPMPRDPYDYDCNWGGFLADNPTIGKVYVKGCKEGMLHILDAATGAPVSLIDIVDEQAARGQITPEGAVTFLEGGGMKYRQMDPLSNYDMRVMTEPFGSPYCGDPCLLYPHFYNGIFSTDTSYNPATGTMFHWTQAMQTSLRDNPEPDTWEPGTSIGGTQGTGAPTNTSPDARSLASGEELWSWYYDDTWIRSHIVTTSNIVWTAFNDGHMRFFHADTGAILREINLGANMGQIGTTTGQDSEGSQKIFGLLITGSAFGQSQAGTLVALGLNERAQAEVVTTTVTTTSRTTITTTTTATSVSTTTATSTTTMTTTSATTVTSTLAAQTVTQTSTAQAQTTTITSEVTEEVGLSSTITYAAVAVAVIAIIAAAVLATRKQ